MIPLKDKKTGLYGYINLQGEWAIPPVYQVANDFGSGLASVSVDEKSFFFINETGERKFDFTTGFATTFEDGYAAACEEVQYDNREYYDKNLNIIVSCDGKQHRLESTVEIVSYAEGYYVFFQPIDAENSRYGLIEAKSGQIVRPPVYRMVYGVSEGLCLICLKWACQFCFIDPISGTRMSDIYEGLSRFSDGFAPATKHMQKEGWNFVDHDYNRLNGRHYLDVRRFSEGLAAVLEEGNPRQQGYIDLSGNFRFTTMYSDLRPFNKGLAIIGKNEYMPPYGIVNQHGDWVFGPRMVQIYHRGMDYQYYEVVYEEEKRKLILNDRAEIIWEGEEA